MQPIHKERGMILGNYLSCHKKLLILALPLEILRMPAQAEIHQFSTLATTDLNNSLESCRQNLDNATFRLEPKKYTIMVYIAADNDLHYFAWNNIKQLAQGAHQDATVVVQLNEPGRQRKTQRYLVEKGKATLLNKDNTLKLDSGNQQTLIDFCNTAIQQFPADEYVLILWNHGTGIIDPLKGRTINPADFFVLNPSNLMLELDRSIGFLDIIAPLEDTRGICFDDTYQTYLTNQKLETALKTITEERLGGKKFAILGLDACLMAMLEVCDIVKNYTHILVASQELELGAGWRYDKMLQFFQQSSRFCTDFASHMVQAYHDAYSSITPDYTLSAINLDAINNVEQHVHQLAQFLIEALKYQRGNSVKNVLKKCKSGVSFDEPSYIDLYAFCENLAKNCDKFDFNNEQYNDLCIKIKQSSHACMTAVRASVFANTAGNNLKFASGISIYFPERGIHGSYRKTDFAHHNAWIYFIASYITS